jgi:predicted TIM-barrel fold metal-dependent hydrolase
MGINAGAETIERALALDASGLLPLSDLDAHEMLPMHLWPSLFGEAGEIVADLYANMSAEARARRGENVMAIDESVRDDLPLDLDTVWTAKGPKAPGVIDMSRRTDVMDVMGVERQLVFQTFANFGVLFCFDPNAEAHFGMDFGGRDPRVLGREVIRAYNRWVIEMARTFSAERMRCVGFVLTDSLDQMMTDASELLDNGARAITIPFGTPPADTSPADVRLDPFWELMERRDIPVVLHVGSQSTLWASLAWNANVPAFRPGDQSLAEFGSEPYTGAVVHVGPENYLTAMILGGVFERFPRLRFGVIELGAQWVGGFAERLDLWAEAYASRLKYLSMKPSEYVDRNVRVTPFVFEDVRSYFERFPNLSHVYAYSSDYPHVEGGKYSKQRYLLNLDGLDQTVINKFFTDNGRWLLP